MAFWGVEVKPGKPFTHRFDKVRGRLHISQATLGLGSSTRKNLVQCNIGDKCPVLLCALLPDKTESCPLDLEFEEENEVVFSVIGPLSVHLTGYYLGSGQDCRGNDDDSDSYGEDIAETETEESARCESEDKYEDDFIDDGDLEVFLPSPVHKSVDELEEILDGENPAANVNGSRRRLKKKYQVSDSDNDEDDGSQNKLVANDSIGVPVLGNEGEDKKVEEIEEKEIAEEGNKKKKKKKKKMVEGNGNQLTFSKRKVDTVMEDGAPERSIDVENDYAAAENHSEEKKKKKRKKNKIQGSDMNATMEKSILKEKKGSSIETEDMIVKANSSEERTIPDGLIIEELAVGKPDGKKAASGQKIAVHYTGKLKKNGKIFDSSIGGAPFKFRLGVGRVIKGWDVGVDGMRVGDKRRLTIPPSMGYGSEGAAGKIPPDSWLVFEIELVKVH